MIACQAEAKIREEAAQHKANTMMSKAADHVRATEQALIAEQQLQELIAENEQLPKVAVDQQAQFDN